MTDRIMFTAMMTHPERGEATLQISVPVKVCWEHEDPDVEPDEDTPTPPHVYSTSGWHTDWAVCPA